ncbi:hypothetical protein [Yoonia sp.]|uniref:hypothetical protein n=1 Tax=Yoonia sp. TaxID=2212373 RepID=UPI003F6CBA36
MPRASDEAAKAFYGQKESEFAEQISRIAASDERLIAIFEKTRERYLNGAYATKH